MNALNFIIQVKILFKFLHFGQLVIVKRFEFVNYYFIRLMICLQLFIFGWTICYSKILSTLLFYIHKSVDSNLMEDINRKLSSSLKSSHIHENLQSIPPKLWSSQANAQKLSITFRYKAEWFDKVVGSSYRIANIELLQFIQTMWTLQ